MKIFKKIFAKPLTGTKSPNKQDVYACGTGVFVGELFVFMGVNGGNYEFLSVPKLINREIPIDRWEWALKAQVIEFAHKLPAEVYGVCVAQWKANKNRIATTK